MHQNSLPQVPNLVCAQMLAAQKNPSKVEVKELIGSFNVLRINTGREGSLLTVQRDETYNQPLAKTAVRLQTDC